MVEPSERWCWVLGVFESKPKALRTHIIRLLGPKTLL